MGNLEKEVKVLNIQIEEMQRKLEKLGAKLQTEGIQKIYVYDLPTIYSRYYDCMLQLKNCSRPYELEVCKSKLKGLFTEIDNLITKKHREELKQVSSFSNFSSMLAIEEGKELERLLSNPVIIGIVKNYGINPNKWVRLRQTNDKTTITIKHILNPEFQKTETRIQPVIETEMQVPSIEEGNAILEQLGFSFRNYQEKRRIKYILDDIEFDLDTWPLIPSYMEIEAPSGEKIKEAIQNLGITQKEIVSCNTAEVYQKYGIDLYQYRDLRFHSKKEELEL